MPPNPASRNALLPRLARAASRLVRRIASGAVAALLASACGGGGSDIAPPVVPTVPTLSITGSAVGVATGPVDLSFLFSDPVSGFGEKRFLVNGGRIVPGSFVAVSPREYTAQIVPFEDRRGTIEIEVFPTAFLDASGQVTNTLTYRFAQPYDTLRPEPWLVYTDSQPGLFASGAVTVTMTFNLDVGNAFGPDDLFVTGATLERFTRVSATVCTVVAVPLPGARSMSIELPTGAVTADVPNGIANSRPWEWFKLVTP
jgi:hypothetical protein